MAPTIINGYTRVLDGGSLDAQTVAPNSSDTSVHVSYIVNDQRVLIKAYDAHSNPKTELAIPREIIVPTTGKGKAVADTNEVQVTINVIE